MLPPAKQKSLGDVLGLPRLETSTGSDLAAGDDAGASSSHNEFGTSSTAGTAVFGNYTFGQPAAEATTKPASPSDLSPRDSFKPFWADEQAPLNSFEFKAPGVKSPRISSPNLASNTPEVGRRIVMLTKETVGELRKDHGGSWNPDEAKLWPEVTRYGNTGDIKEMATNFAPDFYLNALAVASRLGGLTLAFRESGPDTVSRLQRSKRTKGSDVKGKTIKQGSLEKFYGQAAPRLVEIMREYELTGYAGVWTDEGELKGILLSKEARNQPEYSNFIRNQDGPDKDQADSHPFLPLEIPRFLDETSLAAFKEHLSTRLPARSLLENEAFTGDLDLDIIIRSRSIATQGSADEKFAREIINTAISAVDPRRGEEEARLVRHGAEKNYVAHRRNEERKIDPVEPNTSPDSRVLLVQKGQLSICTQAEALDSMRSSQGLVDSRRPSDAASSTASPTSRRGSLAPTGMSRRSSMAPPGSTLYEQGPQRRGSLFAPAADEAANDPKQKV